MTNLEMIELIMGILVGTVALISAFFSVIKFINRIKQKKKDETLNIKRLADNDIRRKEK